MCLFSKNLYNETTGYFKCFLIGVLWVLTDLYVPWQVNLQTFDPLELARLDGEMWRSYYEKKPLKLFWQSAKLMREQVHAPFWRSFVMSYHAAKAVKSLFHNGVQLFSTPITLKPIISEKLPKANIKCSSLTTTEPPIQLVLRILACVSRRQKYKETYTPTLV